MFTTSELDNYVNEAARGYLKEGKSLNDTIIKIASDQGLNRDQIARVVEGSNTEVYVQLMNQSTDKYVQFENASLEKIGEAIFGTEKKAEIITEDYDDGPKEESFDTLEKLATSEETPPNEMEMVKEAYKLAALDDRLRDSMYEVDVRFQNNSDIFYNLVKQAYLSGTSFGDIRRAVETVYDSPVIRKVLTEDQEKLAGEIFPTKLDVDEKTSGSVNPNNPIIKQAGLLVKDTQEFLTLREKIAEVTNDMAKLSQIFAPARAYFKKSANMTPTKKVLTALGVGAVGGAVAHSHLQNVRREQLAMPMPLGSGKFRG